MKKILYIFLVIIILLGLVYVGYTLLQDTENGDTIETELDQDTTKNEGLANPASTNCIEKGGELIIEDEVEGEIGYCLFDDGSRCEEWAFYRGECNVGENK